MFIICLVEKHILPVSSFSRPFFEDTLFTDTMFGTKALPEHGAHYTTHNLISGLDAKTYALNAKRTLVPALSELHCYDFPGHDIKGAHTNVRNEKQVTRWVTQRASCDF